MQSITGHPSFRLLVAVTLTLTAGLGPLPGQNSARADDEVLEPAILGPEDALRLDAQFYAEDYLVSVAEAERRLALQPELNHLIGLLESSAANRFAGGWIEHAPEFRVVARFTGDQSGLEAVRSVAADAPAPVELRTGAAHSLPELLTALATIQPTLDSHAPGASSDVDIKTGEVLVNLPYGADAPTPELLQDLERQAGATVRAQVDPAPASDGHTYGGKNLLECTTGFTVKNSAGTKGVLTAGHCGDSQTYYENSTTSYAITWVSEIRDADQDVQWHTTPHAEYPQFLTITDLRTVTGTEPRSAQAVGDFVCHRGKATGYSCGTIESTTYQPTWSNACNGQTCSKVWIKVSGDNLKCYAGDSGGPWFNSSIAYGIYKGQSSNGTDAAGCYWAVYMAINYASGLGVSVLTG